MRRALLLFNPASGRRHDDRLRTIETVAQGLRSHGVEVHISPTRAAGTAGEQATEACVQGFDTVFACGGDGTVHEAVQGMAFHPEAALGVIPLGSANALARHLHLSLDPIRAALQQLDYQPQQIPLGKITFQTTSGQGSRYFTVMAGAGPDGALVYTMLASDKLRLGRWMYYVHAAKLFFTRKFSSFTVTSAAADRETTQLAVSAMCVRVGDLGGVFSPLIRNASLDHSHLTLAVTRGPARISLPAWFAFSWARLHRWNRYVRTFDVNSFHCGAGNSAPVQVQADGEWLGTTPMAVTLVPNALHLLMPIGGPVTPSP